MKDDVINVDEIFDDLFNEFISNVNRTLGSYGFNNSRDVVDTIVFKDGRYIYKNSVREAINKFMDKEKSGAFIYKDELLKELGL